MFVKVDGIGLFPEFASALKDSHSNKIKRVYPSLSHKRSNSEFKINLKQTSTFRLHSHPIFSSHLPQNHKGVIRFFPGDSQGHVYHSVLNDATLQTSNWIKTGADPCWALSFFEPDTLVISTPTKVRIHRLFNNALNNKESFSFLAKTNSFGELKQQTNNFFLVNSFNSKNFESHFLSFDLQRQRESLDLRNAQGFSNSFNFVPQLTSIYSANLNKTVSLHDIRTNSPSHFFMAHSDEVTSLDVCYEQHLLATSGADSSIRLWDLHNVKILDELKVHWRKHNDSIHQIKFDPSSKLLSSCGADGALKIFHIN